MNPYHYEPSDSLGGAELRSSQGTTYSISGEPIWFSLIYPPDVWPAGEAWWPT